MNHPETVNLCNFLFVPIFVGDFGRELSCKVQQDCNLENQERKLRWDGFKMGVATTLPDLSEWTLTIVLTWIMQTESILSQQPKQSMKDEGFVSKCDDLVYSIVYLL